MIANKYNCGIILNIKNEVDMKNDFRCLTKYSYIGGVCSGLAYYFKLKVNLVRIIMLIFFMTSFHVCVVYLLIAFFAKRTKEEIIDYEEICQ